MTREVRRPFATVTILQRALLVAYVFANITPGEVTAHAAPMPGATDEHFNPTNASIEQLHAALESGRLSSEQLVRYYLSRIERFDKQDPHINALISLNPRALEDARRLDAADKNLIHKGLLYGIPFVAKDNYESAGIATTGGSVALKDSVPATNAFAVQKLLDQGAILLGKSNMSEFAASYGRLGYSSAGGLTVNPYNAARNASGSSSGSAAAVAADFAAFALGTDTSGSIRGPASVNGVAGIRPTLGLVSRGGIIPLSLTFDTPGVLARNTRDLAIVLDAIAGKDAQDAATWHQPKMPGTYLAAFPRASLRGARLGVITNFRGANPEVDEVEQAALRELRAQGAVLVPITLPKAFESLWPQVLGPVSEAEFKIQFERYLRTLRPDQPQTLAQVIEVYDSKAVRGSATAVNPARLEALRTANSTQLTDSPLYIHILTRVIPSIRRELELLITANELQAFVFSTMSCPASPRYDREDSSYVCRDDDPYKASYVAAVAGFPEITVPAGFASAHMPIGYSFMGPPYSEARLLGLADAFQQVTPPLPHPELR